MRKARALAAALSLAVLSGCWDRTEVEQRGFVIGVAIDASESRKGDIRITYQIAVPGALKEGGGGKTSSGGGGKTYLNLGGEGKTAFEITRDIASKTSRTPYFEHLKEIIVSEEASEEMPKALDLFIRDPEMRRGVRVLVCKGEARKFLEIDPGSEKLPVMHLDSVIKNLKKTAKMPKPAKIGQIHGWLLGKESFAVQNIRLLRKDASVSGAWIVKGSTAKLAGELSEDETVGFNLLAGAMRGGIIPIEFGGDRAIFEIKKTERTVKIDASNPKSLKFSIFIKAEGNVGESFSDSGYDKTETLEEFGRTVEREIERKARLTIDKLQKKLNADALHLSNHVRRKHYAVWKQAKKDWEQGENLFSKSEIAVSAKVEVRDSGTANRHK